MSSSRVGAGARHRARVRRSVRAAVTTAVVVLALAALVACRSSTDPDSGAACHPGDRVVCACPNGALGLSECRGGQLGPCVCVGDGGPAGDGAPVEDAAFAADGGERDGGASVSDAGFGEYMGPCDDAPDCPDGSICFTFGRKGKRCTKSCNDSSECPPPSPKCNPRSVCAVPD